MLLQNNDILTEADFQLISEMVYRHCGINLHDGKKELVRARIAKHLRSGGYANTKEYLEQLSADKSGEGFRELIDSLSTNLTSFFRENAHFQFLTERFIPELVARKRKQGNSTIRCWSAGCSSGEEPYTIAITLLDALEGNPSWDLKVLATDISRRVLRTAMGGVYDGKRVQTVSPMQKGRYFTSRREGENTLFEVKPAVRDLIRFRYLNLMETWPFSGPFDFIFCRNVMIYFDKPTQETLVNRYWQCLESGGLLFTGHSESLTGVSHPFRYVQPTIYAKP